MTPTTVRAVDDDDDDDDSLYFTNEEHQFTVIIPVTSFLSTPTGIPYPIYLIFIPPTVRTYPICIALIPPATYPYSICFLSHFTRRQSFSNNFRSYHTQSLLIQCKQLHSYSAHTQSAYKYINFHSYPTCQQHPASLRANLRPLYNLFHHDLFFI